jgi:hypothetical protein
LGNPGSSPQDVVVSVGSATGTAVGRFDISATARPLPPNGTCPTAKSIAFGVPVVGEDLRTAYSDFTVTAPTYCYTSPQPALFYRTPPVSAGTATPSP